MITIDYQTISLVLCLINIIAVLVFFVLSRIIKWEQGIEMWAISSLIGVIGFFAIFLSSSVSNWFAVVADSSMLISSCLILEGVLRFKDIGSRQRRKRWLGFIIIAAFFVSYFVKDNDSWTYLVFDIPTVIIFSMIAYYFLKGTKGTERNLSYIFAYAFVFDASWFAVRWLLTLQGVFDNDSNFAQSYNGLLFLAGIIWVLFYLFGLHIVISYRANMRIQELSERDELTGLYNRRKLDANVKKLLDGNRVYKDNFAVYLLDVNGFKNVNDTLGHLFGDMLLIELAKKINRITRAEDFACRFGGDEFIIILKSIDNEAEAEKAKVRIKETIEEPFEWGNYTISIKTAIGLVLIEESIFSLDEILKTADKNMYSEKVVNYELTRVCLKSDALKPTAENALPY